MRFRLVTVAIVLAAASGGNGRPRNPDPLDSSSEEAMMSTHTEVFNNRSSGMSRYTMTMRRMPSISPMFNRRRDISITSIKYGSVNNKSNLQGHSILPSLSFETDRKNYFPLSGLSFVTTQRNNNNNNFNTNNDWISSNKRHHQSIDMNFDNHNPFVIPFITSLYKSTPIPIPDLIKQNKNNNSNNNYNAIENDNLCNERKLIPSPRSTFKPTPVSISRKTSIVSKISIDRGKRKITSRNLVRITPQKLKPGYNFRRNSTAFKNKPDIASTHLKNWPNEVVQNVQDLLNYERYTTFYDDEMEDRKKGTMERPDSVNNRVPSLKRPGIEGPLRWSKVPTVETLSTTNNIADIDTSMQIDSLLDDLGEEKKKVSFQASSEISQNTVVHIMNADSRKPNITLFKQNPVTNAVNNTKITSTRPSQNVHIMFMVDEDGNQTINDDMSPVEVIQTDLDCPTIMINSITQINNTIESKEGCTDLNIVINSHILNTHVFKPDKKNPVVSDTSKNPYLSSTKPNNYNLNIPSNNLQNDYNQNYYQINKDPAEQVQSDNPETVPEVQTFDVFQGTHIKIEGYNKSVDDTPIEVNNEDFSITESNESTGADAEGSAIEDQNGDSNDITDTNSGGSIAGSTSTIDASALSNPAVQTGQFFGPAAITADYGTGQVNDASGAISLPTLPNIPNIPSPAQLTNAIGSTGESNNGEIGTQTALTTISDDDDEDDILEALSPVNFLDSISSILTNITPINSLNYGILGMAVAPFVAFAAGVVGVAAFLFPWAFPGSLDVTRSWDDNNKAAKVRFNYNLRDVVHSSIHKYRHVNEWKGRRKKKKKKRR